ncbi:hypothetical protein GC176_25805 [bacterium]|nr:hypothetical protein [bacterium]
MSGAGLYAAVEPVDTAHMIDSELELLRENSSWLTVLQAYAAVFNDLAAESESDTDVESQQSGLDSSAELEGPADDDDVHVVQDELGGCHLDDVEAARGEEPASRKSRRRQPWAPRLTSVSGIGSDELSKIHGRLIAYGLLKCDLADRAAGVVYQLTTEARRALEAFVDPEVEAEAGTAENNEHGFSRSA